MEPKLTLDVGCGRRKLGDINVDLRRATKPDVICDIHHLPFPDKIFRTVYCYHVLEHETVKPQKAIKELQRVATGMVEIQVPHWLGTYAKKDKTHRNFEVMHRKYWNPYPVIAAGTDFQYLSLYMPLLVRPRNLTVQLKGAD